MSAAGRARVGEGAVTGWSGPPGYFRFEEHERLDPAAVERVLRGQVAGTVFRRAFDTAALRPIVRRFRDSPARVHRDDDAAGSYLGAYHYGKPTQAYLAESAALDGVLHDVLGGDRGPWHAFLAALRTHFARQGVVVRRATRDGARACPAAVRSWEGRGRFALVPHEDAAQCSDPRQRGFEIQATLGFEVAAANLCLENAGGGRLVYWNVKPDDPARRRLGTVHTGGPYPAEALAPIAELRLDVAPGDLYVFNGAHVHAVEQATGPRSTVACLLGFCDPATVVTWT